MLISCLCETVRKEACLLSECARVCVHGLTGGFKVKLESSLYQIRVHTPDRKLLMTSRDLGVGNGTPPQLVPDNDRMLENMPMVHNNTDDDKVKLNKLSIPERL